MKSIVKILPIIFFIILLKTDGYSQSAACDNCPEPEVVLYGTNITVPMPQTDTTQQSKKALFDWIQLGDVNDAVANISSSAPEKDCIQWINATGSQALSGTQDTAGTAYLLSDSAGNVPPTGTVSGADYIIWSTIDSSGGQYHFHIYLQDGYSRTTIASGEADFTDPYSSGDAANKAISQIEPIFDNIRTYQKNMRNLGGNDIALHAVITIVPSKGVMKSGETIPVLFNLNDCDGTPLSNRWIKISATNGSFNKDSMETDGNGQFTASFTADNVNDAADLSGAYYPYFTPAHKTEGAWGDTTVNINISQNRNWTLYIKAIHTEIENQSYTYSVPSLDISDYYSYNYLLKAQANAVQYVIADLSPDSVFIDHVVGARGTMSDYLSLHYVYTTKDGGCSNLDEWKIARGNNISEDPFTWALNLGDTYFRSYGGIFFRYAIFTMETSHYFGKNGDCSSPSYNYSITDSTAYGNSDTYYLHTREDVNMGESPNATWTKVDSGYIFSGNAVRYFTGTNEIGDPDTVTVEDNVTIYAKPYNNPTGIAASPVSNIPNEYRLYQNYPNPFNPVTTINYDVPKNSLVTIKVYDILGREVKTLVSGQKNPGNYSVEFNADNLSSGVYFYTLRAGNFISTKKLVLMK